MKREILQENPDLWNWLTGQADVPADLAENSVRKKRYAWSILVSRIIILLHAAFYDGIAAS